MAVDEALHGHAEKGRAKDRWRIALKTGAN